MTSNQVTAVSVSGFLAFIMLAILIIGGCNQTIDCWYARYVNNTYAAPSFRLEGRTHGALTPDVVGPIFQTQAELDAYISSHNINLCGGK